MEEQSQEVIFNSLRTAGVPIPSSVSTIPDLTPESLFSVCSHSISIIDQTLSFPSSLPEDSVADRCKICSDLSTAFKSLGFVGDISFHKFLYPSEEDLHKLVRFLVGRLAVCNEAKKESNEKETGEKVYSSPAKEVKVQAQAAESVKFKSENGLGGEFNQSDSNQREDNSSTSGVSTSGLHTRFSSENGLMTVKTVEDLTEKVEIGGSVSEKEEPVVTSSEFCHKYIQKQKSVDGNSNERALCTELAMKNSELQYLQEEYDLLKIVVEMGLDEEHPDFCIQQLNSVLRSRRDALTKLESHWSDLMLPLEAKKRSLVDTLCSQKLVAPEKLQKKLEMEQEIESLLAETEKREDELIALRADLKRQPKVASRQSFVQRIKEITKNSRKLDFDIERILKDTRELQLESNSIQERLDRNYALVNETMFREARKDPVGRQAYRILTGIHRAFEQTAETLLVTDRTRREVADYEAKYATLVSRSINIDKLQADLDSIRKENNILEQQLRNR